MSDTMDVDQQGSDSKRNAMISVNNLTYSLEPDLSVAVNNTHKNHFFQQSEYTHQQRAICILNSGADYIDTTRSYLTFRLRAKSSAATFTAADTYAAYFGENGSALNVINRITISSRSGDELCRIRRLNLLQYCRLPYQMDHQWARTVGELAGYGAQFNLQTSGASYAQADGIVVAIPLYLLSDFFGYGRLMPAMLMSGLRIEIEWEDPSIAFQVLNIGTNGQLGVPDGTGDTITLNKKSAAASTTVESYFIDNIFVSAKSVQLTDATQRALNEMSAVNGLEIVYTDWETTEQTLTNVDKINMEVRKASSRALGALVRVRPGVFAVGNVDSFNAEDWAISQYQWQLGSLYFPQQPIKTRRQGIPKGACEEAYAHTLDAFDKLQPNARPPLIRLRGDSMSGTTTLMYETAGFNTVANTVGVTLERSSLFSLSGIPINNSRVLSWQADFGSTATRNVNIFLKYVKLARVFLNNVEVEM